MLANSFFTYKISERTDVSCKAEIKLNAKDTIYKGHFPEMPVTPGVCQVQMVTEVLSEFMGKTCVLYKARDIKFLNLINPEEQSEFELQLEISQPEDILVDVKVVMSSNEKSVLKMRGTYSVNSYQLLVISEQ